MYKVYTDKYINLLKLIHFKMYKLLHLTHLSSNSHYQCERGKLQSNFYSSNMHTPWYGISKLTISYYKSVVIFFRRKVLAFFPKIYFY